MAPRKTKLLQPQGIRLDPDVKADLETIAKDEDRSLSYIINRALREYVERRKAAKKAKE